MIVGLIVTAIAVAGTYSVKNTGEARFKQVATNLAQEVIEKSRTEKDRLGFLNFNNAVGEKTYCFNSIPNDYNVLPNPGSCVIGDVVTVAGADFTREVIFSFKDVLTTEIEVNVYWSDADNTRSVQLIQQLTKPYQGS